MYVPSVGLRSRDEAEPSTYTVLLGCTLRSRRQLARCGEQRFPACFGSRDAVVGWRLVG